MEEASNQSLYVPSMEHDSCGTGFVAHLKGLKSHDIITDAITMLENMEHRGACGCDPETGDGAGILMQIPHEFFMEECSDLEISLPQPGEYGVGMLFLPKDSVLKKACRTVIDNAIEKLGLQKLGFRKPPVDSSVIGETARSAEPDVEQIFVSRPASITNVEDFERKLNVLRRYINKVVTETLPGARNSFYFPSFSCKVIVYKGQLTTYQVRQYYTDLRDKRMASGLAVVHSRFSTNTFPSWKLAQPFRL